MFRGLTAARVAALAGLVTLTAAGCAGASGPRALPATPIPTSAAASASSAPAPRAARLTRVPSARPRVAPTSPAAARPRHVPSPVDHLAVGNARQAVTVVASGYGTSFATVTAYAKTGSGWVRTLGPWPARIGRNGFAPPGRKREGDGRTPSGSYGFSFFFGVDPAPAGIRYSWRHAASYDVWDDDPSSSRYNLWTDIRKQDAGASPEPMDQVPAYDAAAVIAYNTARTPGLGSAIFFHVWHGSATAGCVSVAHDHVLAMLRWLDPRQAPRIVMGTEAELRQ
jgi:L,D-peptidoglycan transpeptidase YkuD (ErfK/YbiS/YcfS/YnhG family)